MLIICGFQCFWTVLRNDLPQDNLSLLDPGDTPLNFGSVCAAQGFLTLTLFKDERNESLTPYLRPKPNRKRLTFVGKYKR